MKIHIPSLWMHYFILFRIGIRLRKQGQVQVQKQISFFPKLTYFIFHLFQLTPPSGTLFFILFSVLSKCQLNDWLNQGRIRRRKHIVAISPYPKSSVSDSDSVSKLARPSSIPFFFFLFRLFNTILGTEIGQRRIRNPQNTDSHLFLLFRPIFDFWFLQANKTATVLLFQF